MKAYLLAAGLGTRLRPLTNFTPKCLIDIQGKPLMWWWLELLKQHSVTDVLVNTHYLSKQVHAFIEAYNAAGNAVHIEEFYEPELLGSGGTVSATKEFIGEDKTFLICYADNLTNINITDIVKYHDEHKGLLTMALFRTNHPEQCGIAALDDCGKIIEFDEKPQHPKSDLANAGIYVADRALFSLFPACSFCDFGKDVLPKLVGKMYGYETHDYLIDIGSIENLEKARSEWNHDYF